MYFSTHRKQLRAAGFAIIDNNVVDENNFIVAGIGPYSDVWSKSEAVDIIMSLPPDEEEVEVLVRARDEKGAFIPDDPATPDVNEAWVKKIAKKVSRKK
jgi:hypothetical protein